MGPYGHGTQVSDPTDPLPLGSALEESICALHSMSKKKKRAHARSFWRCGTTLSFLSLIHTGSFGWLGSCKQTQKTRRRVLSPLSFWSFCTIITTLATYRESSLSASLSCLFNQGDVYESFTLFKGKLKFTGVLDNIHDTNHG